MIFYDVTWNYLFIHPFIHLGVISITIQQFTCGREVVTIKLPVHSFIHLGIISVTVQQFTCGRWSSNHKTTCSFIHNPFPIFRNFMQWKIKRRLSQIISDYTQSDFFSQKSKLDCLYSKIIIWEIPREQSNAMSSSQILKCRWSPQGVFVRYYRPWVRWSISSSDQLVWSVT